MSGGRSSIEKDFCGYNSDNVSGDVDKLFRHDNVFKISERRDAVYNACGGV